MPREKIEVSSDDGVTRAGDLGYVLFLFFAAILFFYFVAHMPSPKTQPPITQHNPSAYDCWDTIEIDSSILIIRIR